MTSNKTHILIVDDHSVMRKGIRTILKWLSYEVHLDEANTGQDALKKIKEHNFDLIILDISLPDMSGIDILHELMKAGSETKCMMFSIHPEEEYARRVFKLGAVAYIQKGASFDEFKTAVEKVLKGGRYISPGFAEKLVFRNDDDRLPHERLSSREFEIFLMLARGMKNSELAKTYHISAKTVSTYRSRIMQKMNMSCNAELTIYCLKNNLID